MNPDQLVAPLPENTRALLKHNQHAGLLLDKYAQSWDPGETLTKLSELVQGPTLDEVVRLNRESPRSLHNDLFARRRNLMAAMGALLLEARTASPLTLHLARASALENAGICMHRIYGFVYLPGTSVKGMTRAYAETVWFPAQFEADERGEPRNPAEFDRADAAWRQIENVFGYSPGSNARKSWKPRDVPRREADDSAAVGSVVFHDAWPVAWPALVKDILNCHHPEYYRSTSPPGDWEDPIPVYFLAVPAGETFQFALSKRGRSGPAALELAGQWLAGALVSRGAGAKTNSGYGAFRITSPPATAEDLPAAAENAWQSALAKKRIAQVSGTLSLATPGFLAGAEQTGPAARDGCDLRPATLRGLLRWWWRTMHAGFLDAKALSNLEAAIWGDTEAAGVVRLVLENASERMVDEFNFKDRFDVQPQFKREHSLGDRPNQKTSQGLFYASYGMDEKSRGETRRRYCLQPGAKWTVRLLAKATDRDRLHLTAADALEQAEAALWLLCHFGACGSKARKGFGSLFLRVDEPRIGSVEQCQFAGAGLREKLSLGNRFLESLVQSAALGPPRHDWCGRIEVEVASADAWQVMDHIGFAYQAVAQEYAHQEVKASLGLPRQIHGPRREPLPNQNRADWQPPQTLRSLRRGTTRYASPVCIHVDAVESGHVVRAIAFPAAFLPDLKQSSAFLKEFLVRFEKELQQPLRASTGGGRGTGRGGPRSGSGAGVGRRPQPQAAGTPQLPTSGDQVEGELLEERTKKGGWKARHAASGLSGPVQNSNDVPADKKAGDRVTLIVQSANMREIAFKFPTEALLKQLQQTKKKQGQHRPRR